MSGNVIDLSLAILLLPLASFVVLIFFGKKLPRGGDWLGTGLLFLCLGLSVGVLFQRVAGPAAADVLRFSWVDFGNVPGIGPLKVDLGFAVDNLAAIMMTVVCLVSSLVHLFSIGYMHGDVRYSRYFAYLGIFTFSMLMIVLTNNFFLMYVGWELVGLSSYLLIGHWYEKKSASDAAKKAFIVNRIGDIGMFIGILILYFTFRTFTFDQIFSMMAAGTVPMGSETWLTAAGVLVFCGAVGKSAQFPLHVWLPDAMEGPTPVSALIHAATMVAAGVYLVARTFPMMTADALTVIAYVGAITAFISATIAIAQNDIKKVLAYSTVSQLGYMVMGLGVGAYTAGFFHLSTHAMFKAGLFLGSGSVIHAMHHAMHETHDHADPQDIRNMGGLRKYMPVTYLTFLMFTLAISGVPFTSGFLSKDELLAGTMAFGSHTGHYLIPVVGFLVAGMTAFYMFRLVFLTFHGAHVETGRERHLRESPADDDDPADRLRRAVVLRVLFVQPLRRRRRLVRRRGAEARIGRPGGRPGDGRRRVRRGDAPRPRSHDRPVAHRRRPRHPPGVPDLPEEGDQRRRRRGEVPRPAPVPGQQVVFRRALRRRRGERHARADEGPPLVRQYDRRRPGQRDGGLDAGRGVRVHRTPEGNDHLGEFLHRRRDHRLRAHRVVGR